ncbi:uncharacterized protein K452DRAFT_72676 [Aplosporella prunicola CBS 121167]|uniref:Uncharacterized protein n=1 Tax=Aplosporella prunicola CBS 121167 TaxID=1176127 RepID=A0A6A6BVN3_9PEZI|nr:uncharacterized protein K452DRAFT_72676 [Aplosporella prunicola CBS 121167]KAF2146917.1 hypothetical protein K452DRAFT_72676 [Aplosporella prunicola CBS 121167]
MTTAFPPRPPPPPPAPAPAPHPQTPQHRGSATSPFFRKPSASTTARDPLNRNPHRDFKTQDSAESFYI